MWLRLFVAVAVAGVALGFAVTHPYSGEPAQPQMRRPDRLPAPDVTPLKIVALGTSLTQNASWPDRLAQELAACSGRPVEIERIARPGANSDWGRTQGARAIAADPDLVLVEFAINDSDLRDGVSLDRARRNHLSLLQDLAEERPSAALYLMTMNGAEGLRGALRPWLGAHNDQYRRLAAEQGAGLIDLAPLWANELRAGRGAELMPDGLHPTEMAVSEVALPAMVAALRQVVPGCD